MAKKNTNVDINDLEMDLQNDLIAIAADILNLPEHKLDSAAELLSSGFSSITLTDFTYKVNERYQLCFTPTVFFEHKTIKKFVSYLIAEHVENVSKKGRAVKSKQKEKVRNTSSKNAASTSPETKNEDSIVKGDEQINNGVAVIGMSGCFPKATDISSFWENLLAGTDCMDEIPSDRWDWQTVNDATNNGAKKTALQWGAFISDIDDFDPLFFSISPREAKLMDPQQRMLLMHTWKALEDAGYDPTSLSETKTGVFLGVVDNEYGHLAYDSLDAIDSYTSTGSVPSMTPNRISYLLGLRGPSEPVETACSSSLVAIHKAIAAMDQGECDLAIVGAANIILSPKEYISFNRAGMLSEDGRCKSFSKQANGYARGEGVGVLILRRLEKAEQSGDNIYAVVRGSAVNHGGRANSLTAPNPVAQAEVIQEACSRANIDPKTIGCIEAHGTGTVLGDPIEIDGLKMAFDKLYKQAGNDNKVQAHCGISSVKSNIGHLEMAAGIAGAIKVILQLKNKTLIKSLHCDEINPYINLDKSPFYIVSENRHWEQIKIDNNLAAPRRGGVSSFGFGGVNSHVVLEEYIAQQPSMPDKAKVSKRSTKRGANEKPLIIPLSAKRPEVLLESVKNLKAYIEKNRSYVDVNLTNIAYTLQVGRQSMAERLVFIVESVDDLIDKLSLVIQEKDGDNIYRSFVEAESSNQKNEDVINWLKQKNFSDLLQFWVQGGEIDWYKLWDKQDRKRISLPTYPFAKQKYWFDRTESALVTSVHATNTPPPKIDSTNLWDSDSMIMDSNDDSDVVKLSIIDKEIAVLRMEDRNSRNMFSEELLTSLKKKILIVHKNKDLKALIITGYDNIFCVGGTKEGLLNIAKGKSKFTDSPFLYRGLLELDIPVVSAIQGHAFGGGFLFGLYADICVLAEEAIYSSNFMKYGFTPGMGATYILSEKLGATLAKEMMFTANNYDGKTLKNRGVSVNVVKQDRVVDEAIRYARQLVKKPRSALSRLKKEFTRRMLPPLMSCVESEILMHNETFRNQNVVSEIESHFDKLNEMESVATESRIEQKLALQNFSSDSAKESVATDMDGKLSLADLNVGSQTYADNTTTLDMKSATTNTAISEIRICLRNILVSKLHLEASAIDVTCNFKDLGVDSIAGVEMIRDINQAYNLDLEAAVLYDYVTINDLSQFIATRLVEAPNQKFETQLVSTVTSPDDQVNQSRASSPGYAEIRNKLRFILSERLYISDEDLSNTINFKNHGVDSIAGVEIIRDVNNAFDLNLEAVVLYDETTINQLSSYIGQLLQSNSEQVLFDDLTKQGNKHQVTESGLPFDTSVSNKTVCSDIAIIGMAGRFPGAKNLDEYWYNISQGINSIEEVPETKWHVDDFFATESEPGKSYSRWMGAVDDFDKFDAGFFNISAHEAAVIDPQQRVFSETAWHAIEDAGYSSTELASTTCSVYVGVGHGDYARRLRDSGVSQAHMLTGTSTSILASRLSYLLNLRGQSIAIDTACSSSLVALHEACKSILFDESDMCIAGGVYISTTEEMHVLTSQANMLAKDGMCKTFDDSADGFVVGEGAGAVILKRLDKAIEDGDNIHAVIKGTGINQDGATNGITAPSAASQTRLLESIYQRCNINPKHIGLVEAHGTGTELGDPIEMKALSSAFESCGDYGDYGDACAVGSVKTNIGHALAAAGVAGLLKIVMALKNQKLPPSLHYSNPNKHINFKDSPFYVNTKLKDWIGDNPRLAAVSSFGFSGTNAHAVVAEYVEETINQSTKEINVTSPKVFIFSAKDKSRLTEIINNFRVFVDKNDHLLQSRLGDVAYTLQVGRESMEERLGFVANSVAELKKRLQDIQNDQLTDSMIYANNIKLSRKAFEELNTDGEMDAIAEQWIAVGDYSSLLNVWVKGLIVDWSKLYGNLKQEDRPTRLSLPAYPFYRKVHWVAQNNDTKVPEKSLVIEEDSISPDVNYVEVNEQIKNYCAADIKNDIVEIVAKATSMSVDEIETDEHFLEMGADSIILMGVIAKVEELFAVEISNIELFENYFNIDLLAEYIANHRNSDTDNKLKQPTAVVEDEEEILTI